MNFTRILYHSLPFALCACMTFGFTSCSDDDAVTDKNTTVEDEVLDDMLYSDAALIDYIMTQFAELNADGTLRERTRFVRQLDESDSTAIYALANSKTAARAKFLSLLPESYQKKVIVRNDSAEMSLPMGTTPLQISYKEGSTDANVVATVQLPSQGAYTKIANTLNLVKSYGENALTHDDDYYQNFVCRFKKIKHKVLVSNKPFPVEDNHFFDTGYKISVEEAELSMFCYNITPDGVAQYIFCPPLMAGENQLQLSSGKYLLGFIYPWMIKYCMEEGFVKSMQTLTEVLPSARMVRDMTENINYYGLPAYHNEAYNNIDLNTTLDHYPAWFDFEEYLNYDTDKNMRDQITDAQWDYMTSMLNFMKKAGDGNDAPQKLHTINAYFPYQFKEFKNTPEKSDYLKKLCEVNEDQPFFVKADTCFIGTSSQVLDADITDLKYVRSMCFATSQLYTRDEENNDVVHLVDYWIGESGEWEVYDQLENGDYFMSYFKPRRTLDDYKFFKMGRRVKDMQNGALRVVYLYEKNIE